MLTRSLQAFAATAAVIVMIALPFASTITQATAQGEARNLEWEDLMPKDWDPMFELDQLLGDFEQDLPDDDARAEELYEAYLDAARQAPVVSELDGQRVRLPGFVIPLDFEGTDTSEFLLVPYFGACIHVPPPPANQIIYVKTTVSYPLDELFDPVWVTGVISTLAHLNDIGDAGYTMQATQIEPYSWEY